MHDLYEGICGYTIGRILQHFIKEKELDLDLLNNRISSFPYSDAEKSNKPRPIYFDFSKKREYKIKIKQSASEMLCLTQYLGLMIGDKIQSNNKHWDLYKCLKKIVGLLTRPELDYGQIDTLRYLIQEHNSLYLDLYGNLKPKMHLLTHYCRLIELNGPVVHYSSMKFEQQNRKLKEFAVGTTSSLNVPLTIAIRNQLKFCYELENSSIKPDKIELGPIINSNAKEELRKVIEHDF